MPINIEGLKIVLDFQGIIIAISLMTAAVLLLNLLAAIRFRTRLVEYRNINKLEHRQLERLNEIVVEERNCLDQELTKARVMAEAQQEQHQDKLSKIRAEYLKLANALKECQQENKTLAARSGQLQQESGGIRQELERMRQPGYQALAASKAHRELEENVRRLSQELAGSNDELDKEKCIVFELRRRINDLERSNAELKQENTLLVATVTRPPERYPARAVASDVPGRG
jgi:chromosome segregation ATPase